MLLMSVDRQAERRGLFGVDVDVELRRVVLAVRAHVGEQLALRRHAEELVARGDQRVVARARALSFR